MTVAGLWDSDEEARMIGERIETLRRMGELLSEMAILVRAQAKEEGRSQWSSRPWSKATDLFQRCGDGARCRDWLHNERDRGAGWPQAQGEARRPA